jgi:hypothetical protein
VLQFACIASKGRIDISVFFELVRALKRSACSQFERKIVSAPVVLDSS